MSFRIDLETGELGRGAALPCGREKLSWHEHHPETDAPIAGRTIPNWPGVKETALATAARLPFLNLIVWDFVMTDSDIVAVEANASTDVDFFQIHDPLLRDDRIRAFFHHHRII